MKLTIKAVKALCPGGELNEELIHFGMELVSFSPLQAGLTMMKYKICRVTKWHGGWIAQLYSAKLIFLAEISKVCFIVYIAMEY